VFVLFIWNEYRCPHPIIVLRQFRIRNVACAGTVAFFLGWAMFGAISFLPIYFQVVRGDKPTISGLKLIPMMLGTVTMAMISGILITKTGYFYPFPAIGCTLLALCNGLIAGELTVHLNFVVLGAIMFVGGLGMGLNVQSLIIIVQGAVDRPIIAIATATNTFLRTMGGVIGVAVFGSILNNQLASRLSAHDLEVAHGGYDAIKHLPNSDTIFSEYTKSLQIVFWSAFPVGLAGAIVALCIHNYKLQMAGPPGPPKKGKDEESAPMELPVVEL